MKSKKSMMLFYLDNFRGFQNTYIPVLDVNFCVGENSTGKTSFLSLVNLLSSSRFWFEQAFEGGESGFGHFEDIVSISAKNQSYFRIGFTEKVFYVNSKGEEEEDVNAFLFSYIKKDGMPRLHKCTHNFDQNVVTIAITEKTTRYKVTVIEDKQNIGNFQESIFPQWISEHKSNTLSGYSILRKETAIFKAHPHTIRHVLY